MVRNSRKKNSSPAGWLDFMACQTLGNFIPMMFAEYSFYLYQYLYITSGFASVGNSV